MIRKIREFRKVKERNENSKSTYNTDFDLNSVHSPWLCKECDSECVQDVSPLISNDVNTLISEIFICEKIKRSMTLYMNFWSQRVNEVHFPNPFNNRTILSYCSVMCVIQYTVCQKSVWMFADTVEIGLYLCQFFSKLDVITTVRKVCFIAFQQY